MSEQFAVDEVQSQNQKENFGKEIERFRRDGFLGPITLYSEEEAEEIIRRVRIKNHDRSNAIYQDVSVNYDRHFDIQELTEHHSNPIILKYLEAILGKDVLLWRTEWFPKFPGSKATEWHQVRDYSYANGKPQIMPTETSWNSFVDITVWTTFTPATKDTACMKFIRGSHTKNFYDESKATDSGRNTDYDVQLADTGFFGYNFEDFQVDPDWDPESEDVVTMEMRPGQAVIFTASCVHGSFPNTTERETRMALAGRYVPTHVRVYPDQTSFSAHGDSFDLENYKTVLVAGEDKYKHNNITRVNAYGNSFNKL